MTNHDHTPVATSRRRLPIRMRRDLEVRAQFFSGRRHWVVKDPVALKYFHLLDEEYTILTMLNGQTGLAEIQRGWEARFAPRRIGLTQLQGLLADFHQQGLVTTEAAGQGEQLLLRRGRQLRNRWWQAWGNLLALRLPGVDPEPWLGWLASRSRWAFRRPAQLAWLLVVFSAAMLIAVQAGELQARLPEFRNFFTGGNLLLLAVTLAGVKVLHELAHAVTCKHFGGECHEIGVMLLVFTPCLYCDVTDAWLLPSKWRRIAVSAAGIYLEVFLAATATFVWWFSHPGLLNSLALNTILVCSLGTVLFNGNPLMRFDGYYMFADLVEVPNLQARSRAALTRGLARWFWGVELPAERALVQQRGGLLIVYAVASILYRCLVVVGVLLFLTALLEPYRLEWLAWGFLAVAVAGMIAIGLRQLMRMLDNPRTRRRIRTGRWLGSTAVLAAVAAGMLFLPLPCRVRAPCMLELREAQRVYVTAGGTLRATVRAGDRVERGAVLARLSDSDLQRTVVRLSGTRDRQQMHLEHLEARRGADPPAAAGIPAARQMLADLDERLQKLTEYQEQLVLKAPRDGIVIAPPIRHAQNAAPGRLAAWSGTPVDPENDGAYLAPDTLFCLIGDPAALEAVAVIDQADVELIQPGQRVRIRLHQRPAQPLWGTVRETAKIDMQRVPPQLLATRQLPLQNDASGLARPATTVYQVRISLETAGDAVLAGAPGRARIAVAPQSLARRLHRYVSRTFRFGR